MINETRTKKRDEAKMTISHRFDHVSRNAEVINEPVLRVDHFC